MSEHQTHAALYIRRRDVGQSEEVVYVDLGSSEHNLCHAFIPSSNVLTVDTFS